MAETEQIIPPPSIQAHPLIAPRIGTPTIHRKVASPLFKLINSMLRTRRPIRRAPVVKHRKKKKISR